MMGLSHATSGLLAGCGLIALTNAPLPVEALTVALCGGGAMLPDIDHPSSKVARSLGAVTRVIAVGVAGLSVAVYHGTRTGRDPEDRRSGHRLLTHTIPGCVIFGALAAVAVALGPVPAAVTCGLLVALMADGIKVAGAGLAVTGGTVAYWATGAHSGWWWLAGVAVTLGALTHVAGDACTNSGVPLWWPLLVDGRRWHLVKTPATFSTGSAVETHVVTPLLGFGLLVAASAVTGVLPAVIHAVTAGRGG